MNWDKAKNLSLLFLLILNLFLGVLNLIEAKHYNLTAEQEKSILNVLAANKIKVNTEIIKSYKPMKQITLVGSNYDFEQLLNIYFQDVPSSDIVRLDEEEKTLFIYEAQSLTIQNNYVTYEAAYDDDNSGKPLKLSTDDAISECKNFVEKMGKDYSGFVFEDIMLTDNFYELIFRQKYKENLIYSNYIEFNISDSGITLIDSMYCVPTSYSRIARNICSPDEALFTLKQEIKNIFGDKEVVIDKMDIVYNQDNYKKNNIQNLFANPYYRFYITGQDVPFLINAYLNIPL